MSLCEPSVSPSVFMSHFSKTLCLNADVLATIFSFLTVHRSMDAREMSNARNSLLSAALSCKALTEPSLDALWRVIPSLLPMLHLLRSFTKLEGVYILDDIEENDWHLYDHYGKRVREIVFQESSQPRVSPFVYFQLVRMRLSNNGSLLPYLKVIQVASGIKVDTSLMLCLPGPQTKCIIFNDNEHDYTTPFLRAFIAILLPQSPGLTSLTLSGSHTLSLGTVSKLSQLRSLTILLPFLLQPFSFLKSPGTLEHLTDLTLHTGPASYNTPTTLATSGKDGTDSAANHLLSLRCFKLVGHPIAIARTLNHILPTNVAHFIIDEEELSSESSPTTTEWKFIFSRLSVLQHLQSIQINQPSKRSWGLSGYALTMELITPDLINLPNPTKFESLIINNGAFYANTASVKTFCAVFRNLRVLKLPILSYKKCMKLPAVFRCIIDQCPFLQTLQIPYLKYAGFDCTSFIQGQLSLVPLRRPHPLKQLFLHDLIALQITQSGMDVMVSYAEFLDLAFPDLEALVIPDGTNKGWDTVEKVTLALQRARHRQTIREEQQLKFLTERFLDIL